MFASFGPRAGYARHPRLTAFAVTKFSSEADCARSNGIVFSFHEVGLVSHIERAYCLQIREIWSDRTSIFVVVVQITPLLPFFRRADSTSIWDVAAIGVTSIQYSISGSDTSNDRHRIPPRASVTWR